MQPADGFSGHGLTLLVPEKRDPEREAVDAAWVAAGGEVIRLGRFWEPPAVDRRRVRLHGGHGFALVLAQKLDLELVGPPDDLLARLPQRWTKRRVRTATLGDAAALTWPAFVKPVMPKQFRAAVHDGHASLLAECRGLEPETPLLVSEVVDFVAEARAFILDGVVVDVALYEGKGGLGEAAGLAAEVAASWPLRAPCALDVGLMADGNWGVVEANPAWGAGLNGCRAARVLPCIAAATTADE